MDIDIATLCSSSIKPNGVCNIRHGAPPCKLRLQVLRANASDSLLLFLLSDAFQAMPLAAALEVSLLAWDQLAGPRTGLALDNLLLHIAQKHA